MKLTPWFDGSVKPVRVGWYERKWPHGWTEYGHWDGFAWVYPEGNGKFWSQHLPWRGLAQQPKGKK